MDATTRKTPDNTVPEWRDVAGLRIALERNAEWSGTANSRSVLAMLNDSRHLPRRAAERLTEQEGGPPNERYPDPTAVEQARLLGEYKHEDCATCGTKGAAR